MMHTRLRPLPGVRAVAAVSMLLAVAAGCSADDGVPNDRGAADSDWASEAPACDDVWVEGGTLPEGYSACLGEDGLVKTEVIQCTDDGGDLVDHEGYFGRQGGEVRVGAPGATEYEAERANCISG